MYKLLSGVLMITVFSLISCRNNQEHLPIYGNRDLGKTMVDGKEVMDTIYQTIPEFSFVDQDGNTVTNATFKDKIYVADFIFLSCGSICPKMNVQMKRLYEKYKSNPDIVFLSHTFDPEHDSIPRMKKFMEANNAESSKWHLVRGEEEDVLRIANKGYFSSNAYRDSLEHDPGKQYQHEGWFILVDKKGRVRSMKDGTDQFEVDALMKDIDILLKE